MNTDSSNLRPLLPALLLFAVLAAPLDAQWRNTNPFHEWAGEFSEIGMIGMTTVNPDELIF